MVMRFGLFLLSILFSSQVVATNLEGERPFFCDKEGAILKYERRDPDGDIKWYHTMEILSIKDSVNGLKEVEYTSFILNKKGKPYYIDKPSHLKGVISQDAFTMNVAESVESILKGALPEGIDVTSSGGESVLPSILSPNDTLAPIYSSVKALGMTMKVTVTERKVLRWETIQTPAGTFDCVVLRERKVEKGMGRNRHTIADTWYAKGVGMVRHDTYDKSLKLLTSERLVEIIND